MTPSELPGPHEAREAQRQRWLAGRDAAAVLGTTVAALLFAFLSPGAGLLRGLGLACAGLAALLAAALVYRGRLAAGQREARLRSQRQMVEQELATALRRDQLTGLDNRAQFMAAVQDAVRAVHEGQLPHFAVLFIDCDRFKVVNDVLGHQGGDDLLEQLGRRLRETLKAGETRQVARFGGDKFLVLVRDLPSPVDAARFADGLLKVLAMPCIVRGRAVRCPASMGIVTSDRCLEDAGTIIRNAELAMHEAKHAGRGRAVFFSEAMQAQRTRKLAIQTSLRKALGSPQLSLVYQPIIDLETGRRTSVEALARWRHPRLGDISPAEFIPVAEEAGLIVALGSWVLRESCMALARWRKADPANAPQMVSVNTSRAELAQGAGLLRRVRAALEDSGLPPACLQLEVTEREVMQDPRGALAVMQHLREIGVRLAMDDFGTGTSSLACLRDYPFDVVKIDRAFVANLAPGTDNMAVIHATITLLANLGKSCVAEGVETPAQLAILQSLGCSHGQGYHLGRPMADGQVVAAAAPAQGLPAALSA
jgi:diguanylate cyclase (GGDEF)-like protein